MAADGAAALRLCEQAPVHSTDALSAEAPAVPRRSVLTSRHLGNAAPIAIRRVARNDRQRVGVRRQSLETVRTLIY